MVLKTLQRLKYPQFMGFQNLLDNFENIRTPTVGQNLPNLATYKYNFPIIDEHCESEHVCLLLNNSMDGTALATINLRYVRAETYMTLSSIKIS